MIVSMPARLPEGVVCEHPVSGVDIVPTIFSFAGIDLPWNMHGHDLTPLLKDPQQDWEHLSMTAFTARAYGSDTDRVPDDPEISMLNGIPWYVMIRKGPYKYIRTLVTDEIEELYDISKDPEELTNLALQAEHQQTLKRLRKATIAEMRRTGWELVDHLPPVKRLSF